MPFEIKSLLPSDTKELAARVDIFEVVFDMINFSRPESPYLQLVLSKPNFLALVAITEGRVIVGLAVYFFLSLLALLLFLNALIWETVMA